VRDNILERYFFKDKEGLASKKEELILAKIRIKDYKKLIEIFKEERGYLSAALLVTVLSGALVLLSLDKEGAREDRTRRDLEVVLVLRSTIRKATIRLVIIVSLDHCKN
ncbi:hypothetical protein H100_09030, partial [Trichophyton rubrum MR850]